MVYDGNESIVGSVFTTWSGTGDNCDVGAGSGRAGTGGAGYRDGETGRAVSGVLKRRDYRRQRRNM